MNILVVICFIILSVISATSFVFALKKENTALMFLALGITALMIIVAILF
jgi:hypothetical protein